MEKKEADSIFGTLQEALAEWKQDPEAFLDKRSSSDSAKYKCSDCRDLGSVTVFLKMNRQRWAELGAPKHRDTQLWIEQGIFEYATENQYRNQLKGGVYSFAKRCKCRGGI